MVRWLAGETARLGNREFEKLGGNHWLFWLLVTDRFYWLIETVGITPSSEIQCILNLSIELATGKNLG